MSSKDVKILILKQLIDFFSDGNKSDFARKLGISPQGVNTWLSRGSFDVDLVYSKCENISADWLLTGEGAMFRDVNAQIEFKNKFELKTDREVDLQRIPVYNLEASAGLVSMFGGKGQCIPETYVCVPNLAPCDGAIRLFGDSMYPILKSGDLVLFKQVKDYEFGIFWGEMYLVSFVVDGEEYLCVKYLQRSEVEGCVKLVSHNSHYSPQDIRLTSIKALALVKGSFRYHVMQ